ncbi:hypothetical protein [Methylorubrum extorquens]
MELIGWLSIPVGDNFAISQTDTTNSRPRSGSECIAETLKHVRRSEVGIVAEIGEALDYPADDAADD